MDFQLTNEHEKIRKVCRGLAADFATRAAQHDHDNSLPLENYAALKRAGFYGLTVPKEFGGQGSGLLGWSIAGEELAQGCPATALTFNMHVISQETVYDDPIFSREVKERLARLTVHEQKLFAASISEMGTSSLVLGPTFIPTGQAHRVPGGYLLRGRKVFLSMIEACDYLTLAMHPDDSQDPLTLCYFLVPRPSPGQQIEKVWDTLGMRATQSNDLILDDCFVPDEALLVRMEKCLPWFYERPAWGGFSYTGVYLGVGVAAYRDACRVLRERVPRGFSQPLSYHPDIRHRVAEMSVDLEAA